ncbi:NAC domain-containing protein 82-like [Mercurialis annua]|uniref:NAC domain-containing protein 82-like n=1 Tax=Mercurialis annua TaxID=3986 RepID=UPI002160315C|nr:NAC domain-containing protein 82-like [Mercurialis annua]
MVKLSPGFRFHPTDVELVKYYLKRKVLGKKFHVKAIAEVDIYRFDPWDLPSKSLLRSGDLKWYFFCPREKKYINGSRAKRATEFGYWKTTGKDRAVKYNDQVVGSIKTLVFHQGKAPKGDRTDWVMYEYKLDEKELAERGVAQDSYVLCSIFKKDGPGPKNGAQYGAPFREEDWDEDDDDGEEDVVTVGEAAVASAIDTTIGVNHYSNVATTSSHVAETERESSLLCGSGTYVSEVNAGEVDAADYCFASEDPLNEDDVTAMLAHFTEENTGINGLDGQVMNGLNGLGGEVEQVGNAVVDGSDIYDDLGDLGSMFGFGAHDVSFSMDNGQFLELMDLEVPLTETAAGGNHVRPFFGWHEDARADVFGYHHPH